MRFAWQLISGSLAKLIKPINLHPFNLPTRQPVNPSTHQPINLQPINPSTLQPINPSTRQPINQSTLQPIKTYKVILLQVGIQSLRPLGFCPLKMDIALARVGVHGHTEPTGSLHKINLGNNELPRAWIDGELWGIAAPVGGDGQYATRPPFTPPQPFPTRDLQ